MPDGRRLKFGKARWPVAIFVAIQGKQKCVQGVLKQMRFEADRQQYTATHQLGIWTMPLFILATGLADRFWTWSTQTTRHTFIDTHVKSYTKYVFQKIFKSLFSSKFDI